jgi:YHS domain-containing protein
MAKDPVCNMDVDEKKSAKLKHKSKIYYFCSPTCQWAFKENPEQFMSSKEKIKM